VDPYPQPCVSPLREEVARERLVSFILSSFNVLRGKRKE
jgi:hypothetical protein